VTRVRRMAEGTLQELPLVFTHGDFQAAHVLVDGDEVTGIIDWADCVQGSAQWDLAILTVGHGEQLDDVLRGYGADMDRDVIRSMWAFRRLCSIRWMIEHDFDASCDIAMLHTTAKDG
jgi:aminoglycoside phosphotransferase (APT) family kinase protein